MPVSTTRTRATTSRVARSKPTPNDLASDLAAKLTIQEHPAKGKTKTTKDVTPEEERINAMQTLNMVSKRLSIAIDTPKLKTSGLDDLANSARAALGVLRRLSPGKLDTERAASSIAGKLVAMDMNDAAFSILQDMRPALISLYSPEYMSANSSLAFDIISLPFAPSDISDILLTLVATHLLHSIRVLCKNCKNMSDIPAFLAALSDASHPTLLHWAPCLARLSANQHDALFTRAYTALAKATIPPHTSAHDIFQLKVYALFFLARTRPSVVVPDTFWDQAVRWLRIYIEAQGPVRELCDASATLVQCAQEREDEATFLSGRGFVGFCECWVAWAEQLGDMGAIDQAITLLRRAGAMVTDSTIEAGDARRSHKLDAATVCAMLTQAGTVFEKWAELAEEDRATRLRAISAAIQGSRIYLPAHSHTHASDSAQLRDKVRRGFERLRRAVLKLVESEDQVVPSVLAAARTVLKTIADALEHVLLEARQEESAHNVDKDLLASTIDTLLTLARTGLVIRKPTTYDDAWALLQRAKSLVTPLSTSVTSVNFVRCIAGAFHNVAGVLYQAERISHAVRFLREACSLGKEAVRLYRAAQDPTDAGSSTRDLDAMKQLEQQLWRRWELLGACEGKTGDRKAAFDAFVQSIRTFPVSSTPLYECTRTMIATSTFDEDPSLKQLGPIVDRATYMGVCDLFLGADAVSAKSWFADADWAQSEEVDSGSTPAPVQMQRSVVGAFLERQVAGLSISRWKQGVHGVLQKLLQDALEVYRPSEFPMRRARVLLSALELAYYAGDNYTLDAFAGCTVQQIERHVRALLANEELGLDSGLKSHRSEYLAILHLWLALHAHRRVYTGACGLDDVISHSEEACKTLRSMLEPAPRLSAVGLDNEGKSPKRTVAATRTTRRAAFAAKQCSALPKPRVTRATKAAALVTPKQTRKGNIQIVHTATPPKPVASQASTDFDNFPGLIDLLQTVARLIGFFGHMLLKVQLLSVARRLSEQYTGIYSREYLTTSTELARQYVQLGRTRKAASIHHRCLAQLANGQITPELQTTLQLRYAEALATTGQVLKGAATYCDALALSEAITTDEKGLPTAMRIKLRVELLERAAIASRSFSAVQYAKDDPSTALEGLLQSLRLWNRALDTVTRLCPAPVSRPSEEDNPFEVKQSPQDLNRAGAADSSLEQTVPKRAFPQKASMDDLEWRIVDGLFETLLDLAQAYFTRGSPREAEYFIQQAYDLGEAVNAPSMISRVLTRKGEIQLYLGRLVESHNTLTKAADLLVDSAGLDAADIHRLRGDFSQRNADAKGARQLYEEAMLIHEELSKKFSALEGLSTRMSLVTASRLSQSQEGNNEVLVPTVLASILRQHISLLSDENEEVKPLLDKFSSLPSSTDTKAEESVLMAKLALTDAYARFRADMFLGSLAESVITIPMSTPGNTLAASSTTQEIMNALLTAEKSLWSDLDLITHRGRVPHVRNTAISLVLIRALRSSLCGNSEDVPMLIAHLIDTATSITVRREILEAIQYKFSKSSRASDLQWPLMMPNGSLMLPSNVPGRTGSKSLFDEEDETFADESQSLKQYWQSVDHKYRALQTSNYANKYSSLPSNWTVVSISVTDDKSIMFVTRQRAQRAPFVICLPLKGRRGDDRDDDADHLGFDDAIQQLAEIIRFSDEANRDAADIRKDDRNARATWWANRSSLDKRMQELLENIEFCWFGAFKTILNPPADIPAEDMNALGQRIRQLFTRNIILKDKKQNLDVELGTTLLECFSALPLDCKDEELEDVIYFILDLYQFHGVPVAIAEVDIDQVVLDLRMALVEHSKNTAKRKFFVPDSHTFLVLDKNVQGIPWESLPTLRGQSVSRIPSVDFLIDRLELVRQQRSLAPTNNMDSSDVVRTLPDRADVNPRKAYYMLNPSGDLKNTQSRFADWLKSMRSSGWDGIVGRPPSEQQLSNALARNDLVLYFGHGGAEQYIRSTKIRHLPRCAATMLWGCSSGVLREMGDFDRVGTPLHYMLAGCPTLVANLWDVTDRDIDKFAQSVFDDLQLTPSGVAYPRQKGCTSVVTAVAKAREACKLKYLTGAAPVVYGIPFYL